LTVVDVDARGDRVALLGADRGDVKGLSRDGVIAWTATFSGALRDMHPLMTGRAKPGGKDIARCSFLLNGGIRFMRDGSIVVAPGAEPGIFEYDENGKLTHTWDTAQFGMLDDCAIDDQFQREIAADFQLRTDWLARRVILDEILPLRNGPALVLRRVENGVTRWEVVTLPRNGRPEHAFLPVTLASPRAHVRGDVRGDRLVLLLWDNPLRGKAAFAPQEIIVFSIEGQ
jgi:hypothetical protein